MNVDTPVPSSGSRSRLLPIVALALIFGLPFLASVVLYFNPQWLPGATGNRGTLIDPPVDTRAWSWSTIDGRPYDATALRGQWVLLLTSEATCDSPCLERVYNLRQVRRAAGVERARVQRLLAFLEPPDDKSLPVLRERHPRLPLIQLDSSHPLRALGGNAPSAGTVVIIDPLGQAMMRYDADQPAESILKDLKHLLKVSQDWSN